MREVPLGWAGENVSTPHQQSQVSIAFMNNFGLFPFVLCVIPTGLRRGSLHVISMKWPLHLPTLYTERHTEIL